MKKIIDQSADRCRTIIKEKQEHIKKLAEALLEKETLDVIDLIEILGHRPYPLAESLSEYLKEIENRKVEDKKRKEAEALLKKEQEEQKIKEEELKKLKEFENSQKAKEDNKEELKEDENKDKKKA